MPELQSGLMTDWRVRMILLPDGDVVEAGITGKGQWTLHPAAGTEQLPGRFIVPGLVDAHCHLSVGLADGGEPVALDSDAMRANLRHAHAAGVTVIRDTGSPGSATLQLLRSAEGAGLQACGRFLAPAGRYYPALHEPVPREQLVTAALEEVRAGATWIKLIADFPVLSPGKPPSDPSPTYPLADIQRLVEVVHDAGARVAAHSTTPYVKELIDAGIDSVEHGTALDEDDVASLAARGGAWTPTLCAVVGARPGEAPSQRQQRLDRTERLRYLLPRADDQGLTIMSGTDVAGSIPQEVALLAELGLPPHAALAAASTAARRFLGFGGLQQGESADLVTYDNDPRDDPAVLDQPAAIFVRGARIK
jgi:imidazolonepropionase-like amidohydrolase